MSETNLLRRRVRSAADVRELEERRPEDLLPGQTLLACLRAVAAKHPDKPAITLIEPPDFFTPSSVRSYAELVEDVERTANLFRHVAGASPSCVGLLLPMVPEGLSALWGAQTAGIGVPINPFLQVPAITSILNQTRATAVVTTREVLTDKGGAASLHSAVPTLERIFLVNDPEPDLDLATAAGSFAGSGLTFEPDPDPWRDAVVMPTGGTTGTPKLVRMSQAGQLRVAWNAGALMGNEPDTVTAHGMPNFHCGGTISLGLRTILFGGTLLTLTTQGFRSREVVDQFWAIARRYRVTSLLATPTTSLALLHGQGSSHGCCIRDFHVGGSALPMDLVQGFHARFGIWLRENWGMTEMHGTTTGHFNDGSMPRVGSAGRALPFVRVKAVELDAAGRWVRDCAPGERGALLTGTPTVTAGYLDTSLDTDLFPVGLPNDLPAGWRWGNTGDLGTVDEDGYVWVFGRAKDVIIRGGHNIDPKQIEDALALHAAVHIAAAVGKPDRAKGELPVAFVELRPGATTTAEELLNHVREHVHEKAATPVEVVIMDQVPLTPVGKVSKPTLRSMALVREIRSVLGEPAAEVEIDDRGPRQKVVVTLAGTSAEEVRAMNERLVGFEFECLVRHVESVAKVEPSQR